MPENINDQQATARLERIQAKLNSWVHQDLGGQVVVRIELTGNHCLVARRAQLHLPHAPGNGVETGLPATKPSQGDAGVDHDYREGQ
jgi:hypothetical protein